MSCAPEPDPGDIGAVRYLGIVRGAPPLNLLPPTSDRDGNVYVLYGGPDLAEARVFVGHARGGWSEVAQGCDRLDLALPGLVEHGAHGWVGRMQSRAFAWVGQYIVAVAGGLGGCALMLEGDPASRSLLTFYAVVPWVKETPSRATGLAWLGSAGGPPRQVVLDYNIGRYIDAREALPEGATDIEVLGVGGDIGPGEGLVVVRYSVGGSTHIEARFIESDGSTSDVAPVSGLESLPAYGIQGFLQPVGNGTYVGLDVENQLVVIERNGGGRRAVNGMTPIGVQRWEGEVFLVGTGGSGPVVAAIQSDGDLESIQGWDASAETADNLNRAINVIDDRALPSSRTRWQSPITAMGAFPFLHAHSLDHYADATASWLIAGPRFTVGAEDRTAIAFTTVGIAYP